MPIAKPTLPTAANGKLIVYCQLWGRPKDRFYALHNGKRQGFAKLDEARSFARANGFAGIKGEFA